MTLPLCPSPKGSYCLLSSRHGARAIKLLREPLAGMERSKEHSNAAD